MPTKNKHGFNRIPYTFKPRSRPKHNLEWQATRDKVFEMCGGRCYYCGIGLNSRTFTVDHKTARVKGGSDELDNLLPACDRCNVLKDKMSVEEFRFFFAEKHETTIFYGEKNVD